MTESGPAQIRDGWFSEKSNLWPGQAMSVEVDQVLYHSRSKYQEILVFKSKTYGNVLVLDGIIQLTEKDEFSYQEMISHLPLFSHPDPQKVLIIGGGDGGALREVLKHPSVKHVVLCEIDETIINVSRKYFPTMSCSFSDERAHIMIVDGALHLKGHKDEYDVIITDSSDPIGPAQVLFDLPFYKAMANSLRNGGIIAAQGECVWLHDELIHRIMAFCRDLFSVVDYAYVSTPTYPCGQIGFILCAKNSETNFREPIREPGQELQMTFKYYNADMHRASFCLPEFAKRAMRPFIKSTSHAVSEQKTEEVKF